jgi:hypothetical protein
MTVIVGTIEILAASVADRPDLAAIAKMIDDAATRGANLTQQLLALSRKQPLEPRDVDINFLIADTSKLLRPMPWHAMVDPFQLSTALLNLAINARDAMPDGGKLMFETGNVVLDEAYAAANPEVTPGHDVVVAVSDTRVGIAADIRERIFEPFLTTKEIGRGTGLGLSMVYCFIKQSRGHIKVYSESGHGTTIRLYLPRSDGHTEADAAALPGGHETIFVVEDDELVGDYVLRQLQSLGCMSGRQLADEVRKRRTDVKALYTSGCTENVIFHHGRLDPGVTLLPKPYLKSDLARKMRNALEAA